jgi:Xaa-Pro aminopeptidase
MQSEHRNRILKAQSEMQRRGVSRMFIGPGSNLFYLTGIRAMISERIYLLQLPATGRASLLLPTFERLGAEDSGIDAEIIEWSDATGPDKATQALIAGTSSDTVAIDDQLWSAFLLDLQLLAPKAAWTKASTIMQVLRSRKSESEIKIMKEAAAIADQTFSELTGQKFAGRKESEIAAEIQRLLLMHGQQQMQFGIVGSGPNGAMPHHDAGERVIQPGDSVVLDFGGTYKGYQSDMTRMVVVKGGSLDPEFERVHEVVNQSNAAAHAAVKVGALCEDIDRAARKVIVDAGYGDYFTHRTGHGIGIDVHEHPYIRQGNSEALDEGMAFSIEPGVYLPGRFGVRIEDIAICRSHGSENINLTPHSITIVQ